MALRTQVDLTNFSFDEFVSFVFDREILPKSQKYDPWHWHVEPEFDASKICGYYIQLFREPEFLLTRYTKAQLDEGFWAIHGAALECSASSIIDDSTLPLFLRKDCIRSMFDLFQRLFATESLENAVHMWWDSFCYSWECGNRKRENGGEDLELQDVYFETLAKVLAIDSEICHGAALHGLSHLHHPQSKALIDRFIAEHPSLAPEQKEYALAASRFELM